MKESKKLQRNELSFINLSEEQRKNLYKRLKEEGIISIFNEVTKEYSKEELKDKVETWFGIHMIEIQERNEFLESENEKLLKIKNYYEKLKSKLKDPLDEIFEGQLILSPTSQTSPKGDFSNEKEHNISLKDNSNELSQISSNDETSLNNNIPRLRPNSKICSKQGETL